MELNIGDKAPDFTLEDQNGKKVKLSSFRGRYVLLYFYPRDNTPGCSKEACAMRDAVKQFDKMDSTVLGVSADSVESHKKFSDKYALPFSILADESRTVIEKYGVWQKKNFMGRELMGIKRSSVLIGPDGKVAAVYKKVKPAEHAEEVIKDIRRMAGE